MMNIKKVLFATLTVVTALGANNLVSANSNLSYPPADVLNNYPKPSPVIMAPPIRNTMSSRPAPYEYGQNNSQQNSGFIPSPMQAQNFTRMPVQPPIAQNNGFNPFTPNNFGGNNNSATNNLPFSNTNMMPFGNNNSNGFNPFNKGNMPFSSKSGSMIPSNPMNNMFGNNGVNNWNIPFTNNNNNRKKAWGDERHIWPDFYTDFTDDSWDTMMSTPRDMGRMPGGWRFPYISMPDPVTVSDAITNQFPPIAEEAANMADFTDWGVFDN